MSARKTPAYFVVRDWYGKDSIAVITRPPEGLKIGQTIDVKGILGTLPNGQRCVQSPTVFGYLDSDGKISMTPPISHFNPWARKEALLSPTSAVPPSDPSETSLRAAEVTTSPEEAPRRFNTIADLLAFSAPVGLKVKLECIRVADVGSGFVMLGDDSGGAMLKVYSNTKVDPTDRIISVTGAAHTENGATVLYADNGPSPYFDPQGFIGEVRAASPGTTAYAATLSDPTTTDPTYSSSAGPDSSGIMSVGGGFNDGSWVYLTGQVVTAQGSYWSCDMAPDQEVWINYIQGVDRLPGIRVWANADYYQGAVIDVMAKLDTKDGERILGVINDSDSIETKVHVWSDVEGFPNIKPVAMNHRTLGGAQNGNNPSVTGGSGVYNIGSRVRIFGKVIERGNYNGLSYMVIDDGSNTPTGGSGFTVTDPLGGSHSNTGVLVFGYTPVSSGNDATVEGISSVWKPNGSSDTYRAIQMGDASLLYPKRNTTQWGEISGVVKLYDMPNPSEKVKVCCSSGQMVTLTVTRGSDNSGSGEYTISNVPKVVHVTGQYSSYDESPAYLVSAQCVGFKTRTYTQIAPDSTRNLYLTRLRKLYLTTNSYDPLYPCSPPNDRVTLTATALGANHSPIQGITVRFRTNKGSFSSGSIVHSYTPSSTTNTQGQVTAILYGVPSEWGNNDVVVEATDDSAPLSGDYPDGDPYKYDWE
ncbi:MAG: hypothetical protein Q7N50_07455, partial [Armatimonadota bacterium]|nr:hypothetical protein [Armatimonadota bacterium]